MNHTSLLVHGLVSNIHTDNDNDDVYVRKLHSQQLFSGRWPALTYILLQNYAIK